MHNINFIRENPIEFDNFMKNRGENPIAKKIIDIDKEKCKKISQGVAPFFEKDLEKTLQKGLKKELEISDDVSMIKTCDYVFVTVGTPQKSDGSIELSMIKKVVNVIATNL